VSALVNAASAEVISPLARSSSSIHQLHAVDSPARPASIPPPLQQQQQQQPSDTGDRSSGEQVVQDRDEDAAADGDEENDDSDCSGIDGPGSTSTVNVQRAASQTSLDVHAPAPGWSGRCQKAAGRRTSGKRRGSSALVAGKCVKLCVSPAPRHDTAAVDLGPPATLSAGLLAPSTALTTRTLRPALSDLREQFLPR